MNNPIGYFGIGDKGWMVIRHNDDALFVQYHKAICELYNRPSVDLGVFPSHMVDASERKKRMGMVYGITTADMIFCSDLRSEAYTLNVLLREQIEGY